MTFTWAGVFLDRKKRCVVDGNWCAGLTGRMGDSFGYRHLARTGSANLALRIPKIVCLRTALQRVGNSKREWCAEQSTG